MSRVGLVAIGRNEGQRLKQCLHSALNQVDCLVYVDSGSIDGSVEFARSLNVTVVELELSIPFTAARARNAGLTCLLELDPQIDYVQFVDGDCEIVTGWLQQAQQVLDAQPDVVVVCGRRRERYPEASIYNKLCDIEWDTPVGEALYCGGDAMMQVAALQAVGGYNPALIAGEEPELCVRLRRNGGRILRLAAEMTLHDAQMTCFRQWWRRMQRAGYAYAEGSWLQGRSPARHWVKESRRIWVWGVLLPGLILAIGWLNHGISLLLLALYPLSAYRTYCYQVKRGLPQKDAALYSLFCVLDKIPSAQGQLQFHLNRLLKRRQKLIEYKTSSVTLN